MTAGTNQKEFYGDNSVLAGNRRKSFFVFFLLPHEFHWKEGLPHEFRWNWAEGVVRKRREALWWASKDVVFHYQAKRDRAIKSTREMIIWERQDGEKEEKNHVLSFTQHLPLFAHAAAMRLPERRKQEQMYAVCNFQLPSFFSALHSHASLPRHSHSIIQTDLISVWPVHSFTPCIWTGEPHRLTSSFTTGWPWHKVKLKYATRIMSVTSMPY